MVEAPTALAGLELVASAPSSSVRCFFTSAPALPFASGECARFRSDMPPVLWGAGGS